MKYFILIMLCFLTCSFHAEEKKEPEFNATIWQDGDGMMLIYYHGHYFFCYPEHIEICPCMDKK